MAKRPVGYEITEEDINGMIHAYSILDPEKANREDAIKFLEKAHVASHFEAHQIVEDLMSGKLKIGSKAKK